MKVQRETEITFFKFNIWVLKTCLLWPEDLNYKYDKKRFVKDVTMVASLMPCFVPILADFLQQLYGLFHTFYVCITVIFITEEVPDLTEAVENMIALNCLIGMFYMVICFVRNRKMIIKLMARTSQLDFKVINFNKHSRLTLEHSINMETIQSLRKWTIKPICSVKCLCFTEF